MILKDKLKHEFNIDFPIKGENVLSIDNPIVIEKTEFNDYVGTEHVFLQKYAILKNITWFQVQQSLLNIITEKLTNSKWKFN